MRYGIHPPPIGRGFLPTFSVKLSVGSLNQRLRTIVDSILELATDLLQIPGISGHEDGVANYVDLKLGNYGPISRDSIGNRLLRVGNPDSKLKILVTAHMDSVGFIIKEIMNSQEAKILPVGISRLDQYNSATAMAIGEKEATTGEIMLEKNDTPKFIVEPGKPTFSEAAVDIGDQVVIRKPTIIRAKANVIEGCWLDNRIGLSVLINLAKTIPGDFSDEVMLLASVREEIGAKGIEAVLRKVQPDFAIVIDATWPQASVRIGQGPVLTVLDPSVVVKSNDRRFITRLASDLSIPLQKEVLNQGASDAGPLTRAGIPTFCLMFPVKGLHTPSEMVALEDVAWNLILARSLLDVMESMKLVS